jgi:riboflavin biosynthesis pyrimidine reductase
MQPVVTLYERTPAPADTLPPVLASAYGGGLLIPEGTERPYVIVNFVQTIDGVIAFDSEEQVSSGAISGRNEADHMVMGLLRARADAVIFGAGSLHEDRGHIHTPAFIYPPFEREYHTLRMRLGRTAPLPLSVVVSASGDINLNERTFHFPGLRVLIVTTYEGANLLARQQLPDGVAVRSVEHEPSGGVAPASILALLASEYGVRVALHEGGPRLLASFLAAHLVDELFLTVAPQIVGRLPDLHRLSLVENYAFSSRNAPWADLQSIKLAGSHLFLRYRFSM